MFRTLVLLITFVGVALVAQAQQTNPKPEMPDITPAKFRTMERQRNASFVGMLLPEFVATMEDGRIFSNASLRGKVSLLVFWYPSCNCFQPEVLGALPDLMKQHKDFQIISVMPDTADLALFRNTHRLVTPVANLQSHAKGGELKMGNGYPSCMLIKRDGTVARISGHMHPSSFDQQGFIDAVRELLMF